MNAVDESSGRPSAPIERVATVLRRPVAAPVLLLLPLLEAALVGLATRSDGLYRFLVREDALLEWAQVTAYLAVVAVAVSATPGLWRRGDHLATLAVVGLGLVCLLGIGEEMSWGQRLVGFATPQIASQNSQGELTLHNDRRLEPWTHRILLTVGLYGLIAPVVVRRRTPLVPPRTLTLFFAVIAVYYTVRLGFLDAPGYVRAKYSEWPETCFAVALVVWCLDAASTGSPPAGRETPPREPRGLRSGDGGEGR